MFWNAEVRVIDGVWVCSCVPSSYWKAVTIESKSGRGAVEVARGRVSRVELTGGEAAREMR